MGLKDLRLKRAYSTDVDNVLQDFYVPALQEATDYRRLTGFFSSTSLAVAARGILGLIDNGGTMKLITCPRLTAGDLQAIESGEQRREERIVEALERELRQTEENFIRDHVAALAWMVAAGRLEMKLCLVNNEGGRLQDEASVRRTGIFHQKVGVLRDEEGNALAFSGSLNETAAGWLGNIEEFKVFRGWVAEEADYLEADTAKFERLWEGRVQSVEVVPVPEAVREHLVEIAPDEVDRSALSQWRQHGRRSAGSQVELYEHQREAVDAWVANGHRGIFHMATGTGKTFTALGCLRRAIETHDRLTAVITCPYSHLLDQWQESVRSFGVQTDVMEVADGNNPGWKRALASTLIDVDIGHITTGLILATHDSFASAPFREIVHEHGANVPMMLVADEVHGLGASKMRLGLVPEYDLRLGLSATPTRFFDPEGTELLDSYFGGTVFEFGLERAVTTINPATGTTYLTPYRYLLHFVSLDDDELEEYHRRTLQLVRQFSSSGGDRERQELLELLLFKRAEIVKDARAKYPCLEQVFDDISDDPRWTLVYCSPGQIDEVMMMLSGRGLVAHRFTMDEGTKPDRRFGGLSERQHLLKRFEEGDYEILVAMRCLDEGVDVPAARTAVLMASSRSPRQYVQRIGRILRPCHGKRLATVHDMVIVPREGTGTEGMRDVEQAILDKETERCEYIASSAENRVEALSALYEARRRRVGRG